MTLEELTKRMNRMIGETNVGETFTPTGNLPGDHTGFETHARDWYQSSVAKWAKVYRITGKDGVEDRSIAHAIAEMTERFICNGFIGYETGDSRRNTLLEQLEANNFTPEKIDINVDTDCSAMNYAAIRAVTGVVYDSQEAPGSPFNPSQVSCRVSNFDYYMERQLPAAGYMVTVYTIPTDESVDYDERVWYSTMYDTSGIENLTPLVSNEYKDMLNTGEGLLRGDLIRTTNRTYPLAQTYGHSAIWL